MIVPLHRGNKNKMMIIIIRIGLFSVYWKQQQQRSTRRNTIKKEEEEKSQQLGREEEECNNEIAKGKRKKGLVLLPIFCFVLFSTHKYIKCCFSSSQYLRRLTTTREIQLLLVCGARPLLFSCSLVSLPIVAFGPKTRLKCVWKKKKERSIQFGFKGLVSF